MDRHATVTRKSLVLWKITPALEWWNELRHNCTKMAAMFQGAVNTGVTWRRITSVVPAWDLPLRRWWINLMITNLHWLRELQYQPFQKAGMGWTRRSNEGGQQSGMETFAQPRNASNFMGNYVKLCETHTLVQIHSVYISIICETRVHKNKNAKTTIIFISRRFSTVNIRSIWYYIVYTAALNCYYKALKVCLHKSCNAHWLLFQIDSMCSQLMLIDFDAQSNAYLRNHIWRWFQYASNRIRELLRNNMW